jgi:hypothetical protein
MTDSNLRFEFGKWMLFATQLEVDKNWDGDARPLLNIERYVGV